MSAATIPVLLISGYGRSGSTFVDQLIGQHDRFVSTGELNDIWERSFGRDEICECREPFSRCPFWQSVVQAGGKTLTDVDGPALHECMNRVIHPLSNRALRGMRRGSAAYRRDFETYREHLGALYRGIHEAAGGRTLIDSSKNPFHGFATLQAPGVEARVLHLVRDSRAVAYSWKKRQKYLPEQGKTFHSRGYARSAIAWMISNVYAEKLASDAVGHARMRYEDFIASPKNSLEHALRDMGYGELSLDFIENGTAHLTPRHMVAGNPSRFRHGAVDITPHEEWRDKMTASGRRWVTFLTAPWLRRYGYAL